MSARVRAGAAAAPVAPSLVALSLLALSPLALGLGGCRAPGGSAYRGELQRWGTLREALRDGRDEGRVALAEVATAPAGREVVALGALEGLAGEVTLVGGEVWVTRGDPERPLTRRGPAGDERATVLFRFEVARWLALPVSERVAPEALEDFVRERARAAGLDVARPFPFLVDGPLEALELHVVNGECPLHAGAEADPYRYAAAARPGRLVGIHAPGSQGVVCSMGARTHVHAVLQAEEAERTEAGPTLTGHVERVGLGPGAVLRLPAE